MAFVSKDKLAQRYLLSKYAESMSKPVAFAYLDTPQFDATAYFCAQDFFKKEGNTLYPINMPTDKELPMFEHMSKVIRTRGMTSKDIMKGMREEFGNQALSNLDIILKAHPQIKDKIFPKKGDIVSVLNMKEHENMFDIIWLDWCATHKKVGTFNDFVKASFAFKQQRQPSVLAVTLSTHAIPDTLDGAVKIPGFKVLRYMNFLLNKSTGIGFSIKTSTVYPGLDRDDVDETATRMVFLVGTTTKPLKIPTRSRALAYGEHIGKRLLVPIKLFGNYNSQSSEFRKFLCVNEHIVARVYNGCGGRQEKDTFHYYLQYKPICSDWYTEPAKLQPRSFSTEEILQYADIYKRVVTDQKNMSRNPLGLLCQAQAEGGTQITDITQRAFSQIDNSSDSRSYDSFESESNTAESKRKHTRYRGIVKTLLKFVSSDEIQLKSAFP